MLEKTQKLGLLTVKKSDPTGYGRILRNDAGKVTAIVEQKDANDTQREINEVNTGIIAVSNAQLKAWLPRLNNNNAQGEFYLTDIAAMAVADGYDVATEITEDEPSVAGVNSKLDLAELEREYQQRYALKLMRQGVTCVIRRGLMYVVNL